MLLPCDVSRDDNDDDNDTDESGNMDFIDEDDGIENVTSERTGIKIIPLFESATTFINGSIVDNEAAPASPACPTLAPR